MTVGSLQVTCSRLGVSLRRPVFNTRPGLLQRSRSGPNGTVTHNSSGGNGGVLLQLTNERLERNLQGGRWNKPTGVRRNQKRAMRTNEPGSANLTIRMQYKGKQRSTELPLTQDMIRQLAFEAEFRT